MDTVLVLGATGGVGGEMAKGLLARGWHVRAMVRDPARAKRIEGVELVRGDAMQAADVAKAATGVAWIVHGVNPPGYRNWPGLALPMLENTIAAAKAVGAAVFFPGTVYNFGPETFPLVAEDAPQRPRTRKGAIRVAMEARLRESGLRVLILRSGDFFGPGMGGNSWFSGAMVKPGRQVKSILYPGRRNIGHGWAYLPDYAEAAIRLMEQPPLERFAVFHFEGHWLDRGFGMAEAVREVVGPVPVRLLPSAVFWLAAPFSETFREMLEMTYLWRQPLRLDNRRLVNFLGGEPRTEVVEAVRAALAGLGCL